MGVYEIISTALNLILSGGLFVTLATLRSQRQKAQEEAKSLAIENDRKVSELVNEYFVEPLKREMTSLRRQVSRLSRAVEKIPLCSYSDDCPVRDELDKFKPELNENETVD